MRKYKNFIITVCFITFLGLNELLAQTYRPIINWNQEINDRIESFLEASRVIKERKVAVFDYDGTLMGQVPFYMVDEAIIDYTFNTLVKNDDQFSKDKVNLMEQMLQGSTSSDEYVENRVRFLSGFPSRLVEEMGFATYEKKYKGKIYQEMRQLVANLEEFGFEIWIISTSPEVLYQEMISREFGIPKDRILGTKAVVVDGVLTDELIPPLAADQGKADVIHTFIKAKPLFVAGNSRGDMEMTNESVGLKLVVNPDDEKVYEKEESEELQNHTLRSYWKSKDAIIVYCHDMEDGEVQFEAQKRGVVKNKTVEHN